MATHKDLDVWKMSIALVKDVYRMTNEFPKAEQFGLISQMRRASVSIPSNIAEGAARSSVKEYLKYLYISLGSLAELETQMIISKELNFVSNISDISLAIEDIRKKLLNLIKYLKMSKRD